LRQLSANKKSWPVRGSFTIARSSLQIIPTIWVEITEGGKTGRAECRPYARYGDTVESVLNEIESLREDIENGLCRTALKDRLRPGPARNALDCALWDLEAKQKKQSVTELLNLPEPRARVTAFTLSLQSPNEMAKAARDASKFPLLKIKVDNKSALSCSLAVIEARPDAQLIIDANESLDAQSLNTLIQTLPAASISMIEQPIHADRILSSKLPTHIVICADESLHSDTDFTRADLEALWQQGYRAINIKLDKCGGLTAAYELMKMAKSMDFKIMAGCMVGSSLAMAPILILESLADVLDLDGPLLLENDCDYPLLYQEGMVQPPTSKLWG